MPEMKEVDNEQDRFGDGLESAGPNPNWAVPPINLPT